MKKKKFNNLRLVGKEFYLRPIQPKDIGQNYLSWMNDKKMPLSLKSTKLFSKFSWLFARHLALGLHIKLH